VLSTAQTQPGDGNLAGRRIHRFEQMNQRRLSGFGTRCAGATAGPARRALRGQLPEGLELDRLSDRPGRESCLHPVAGLLAFLA